jgi:uncharacterized protein (TIRG00374 family)
MFFLLIGVQTLSTLRWHIILKKDINVPFPRLLSIYFIGMFFNNFLPTLVGGDVVKAYYLYRDSRKGGVSLASIFLDRYSGFTALMTITALATYSGYSLIANTSIPWLLFALLAGFVAISLVIWIDLFHGWVVRILNRVKLFGINNKIDAFYKALMGYKGDRGVLLKIFFISVFIQVSIIVGYYILSRGIGMEMPLNYFFMFVPLATVVAMLPVSLAGLGIREGAFVFLFAKAGGTSAEALSISLLFFFIMVVVSLIGGVAYIRVGSVRVSEIETKDMEVVDGRQ